MHRNDGLENSIPGQADVILCKAGHGGARAGYVVELGELAALIEDIVRVEAVEHGRHPPGEALRFPDAAKARFGVALKNAGLSCLVKLRETFRHDANVCYGEVETFGACRRNDVRGIAGQKQFAVLHRLDNVNPHSRGGLLEDRAFAELPIAVGGDSQSQFAPNAFVGPGVNVFIERNLEIEAAHLARAHGQKGEATLVIAIDQFVRRGRGLRQYAQPTEWIEALEFGEHSFGNARAADAVEAVAAGDVVALDFFSHARCGKTDGGFRGIQTVHANVARLENKWESRRKPRGDEVFNDFVLRIDRDGLASGQIVKVDAVAAPVESQSDAVVGERFALEALADAGFDEQIDGALFEEASANSLLDVFPAARFDSARLDALQGEQMGEN